MSLQPLSPPLPVPAPHPGLALLTGVQKAAILLLRLGNEQAGLLLRKLARAEVAAIMAELSKLGTIDRALADSVVHEFLGMTSGGDSRPLLPGDVRTARELLSRSLGDRVAYEVLRDLDRSANEAPFHFLQGLEPHTVAENIREEHPQTIALVLTHLDVDFAAAILSALPVELLGEVGVRVGTLDRVTSTALEAVERALRTRLAPLLQATFAPGVGGVDTLVELLTKLDKGAEQAIASALDDFDPELAKVVRGRMFTFDDLVLLTDRQMQLLLRHVDSAKLPLALKGVRDDVKDRILNNLSSRARDNLLDEIDLLGQVRLSDVEAAQAEVLEIVRNLEASGELAINRGGGDFVS